MEPTTHTSRRRRGRAGVALASLLSLALIAAACGSDDDDGSADTAPATTAGPGTTTAGSATPGTTGAPSDVDPNGTLRIGGTLQLTGGVHFDPTKSTLTGDAQRMELVFGTLLRHTADGKVDAWMAQSYQVVDPQTLTLTLRDGMKFTDGAAYDATAVRAGLLRTLNESAEQAKAFRPAAFRAITEIIAEGTNKVTIKLGSPQVGGLIGSLAEREGAIVSPTQVASDAAGIDTKPVGAGPYTLTNFTPEQRITYKKNPAFFDAAKWRVGGIEFIHSPDAAGQGNGLLTDQFDYVPGLPVSESARFKGNSKFAVQAVPNERFYLYINFCSTKAPFDNVNVRKAVQLGIDREAISDLVYDGTAPEAAALWPKGHPNYNASNESLVKHDPEEAKKLLAGQKVSFDLYVAANPEIQRVSEVVQSSLSEVGFTVNLINPRDILNEFIVTKKPGAMLIGGTRTGPEKYTPVFTPGALQVLCDGGHPELLTPLNPVASAAPGDPTAARLYQAADKTIAENAWITPIVFTPNLAAWSKDNVGGEPKFAATNSALLIETLYIKK